ncbi:hypothetical protein MRS44_016942 [Fusarium solani]|uniref:BTB domain-containing protein n=1 Tax=Fusarium solani TaxID=169388 RepID=A0A9P9GRT8_FUSSL|nr:uncharacterized protein B0J15DRAFT_552861 [Fusarium solani]KAH7243996.1 hypothetical protein B0J15DRAFT_552861 [Fusarium solani]KAJ3455460.1 hypothetical protein MRS44_016942 [Fusarium solani]
MNSQQTISQIVKAREAEEFTDFVFVCEGQRIPVHGVIVCSQSPVLRAACTGPFKEASGQYFMDDHPLSMVRRMVDYLYTGNYAEEITETGIEDQADVISPLRVHAMMFAMGEKYRMEGLQCLSVANYANALSRKPNICNFIRSLPDVYTLTPDFSRGLRDKALEFARENLPASLASTESKDTYDKIAADAPEFIKDLLDSFLEEPLVGSCSGCGRGKLVPVEAKQCKCKRCGKGGAIPITDPRWKGW